MTALLDVPAPPAGLAGRRSRAGGPAAVLAALLVLAGVLWSVLLWAPTTVSLSTGAASSTGPARMVTVPEYGARGTHVVDYQDGTAVELVVPLRNDGPLPVRVASAEAGAVVLPLLQLSAADLPVTVAPGATEDLVLRGVLGNCAYYHERQLQNVDELQLRLEVLGRGVTRAVPLDRPLLVHSPMIVGCPERTLTRNDDRRTPDVGRL